MWSSRLFWKMFFSYSTLALVATITFAFIVESWHKVQVVSQIEEQLYDSAVLIRADVLEMLPEGRTPQLQALVRLLGSEIDSRITLVTMDGLVLADSEQSSLAQVAEMENHKTRPELLQAAAEGRGSSQHISPTLGVPMLYVALRVDQQGQPVGLVRTALPLTVVNQQAAEVRQMIWLVVLLVGVGIVAVTYFVVARIIRPLAVLTHAAEATAAGNYEQQINMSSHDELGELADSFNRMNRQLRLRDDQLRDSSQRLGAVLEGMMEGVIAVDDRGRVALANAAAGRLLGFSPEHAQGRPLLETVRDHVLYDAVTAVRSSARPQRQEIKFGDEEKRVIAVNATVMPGEAAPLVVMVLHDVTELRRLESLRQEFVANVSHELKTPLSSIKAYAETLGHGAINDQHNNMRFVRQIEEQAERLHELIMDLLSLARIESGQQAFDIGPVSVAEVAKSCVADHQALAAGKNVTLAASAEAPAVQVEADEEGLKQILNNLIDNALKYTPAGGRVDVDWRRDDEMAVIDVRDTGIGIAAEHLPRLFERFFRVDKARSRELGGTGLGLSIVKHLAQSFGGSASVASRPGQGSTFTVRLPVA